MKIVPMAAVIFEKTFISMEKILIWQSVDNRFSFKVQFRVLNFNETNKS